MSIKQIANAAPFPDFRNLGVVARVLVGVNLVALAAALHAESGWQQGVMRYVSDATLMAPVLFVTLSALYVLSPFLASWPFPRGHLAAVGIAMASTTGIWLFAGPLLPDASASRLARALVFAGVGAALMLAYLRLHAKAYSPALSEARLQALQARIRPHFLFNSLNAVLTLIRRDPRRAEQTLEDLADLFRVLMSDGRQFVRLADEVALIERYASIESLRLGDRLQMTWEVDNAPMEALLPPLVLQPLLENAIDYLLKPVRAARLAAALKKAVKGARPAPESLAQIRQPARGHLSVVERNRILLVPIRDIVYLRAEQKYVTLRTREREYLIEESLTSLEKEYAATFIRIHRNCLVARAAIRGFERLPGPQDEEPRWEVQLDGIAERLTVSRRQWPAVREIVAERTRGTPGG